MGLRNQDKNLEAGTISVIQSIGRSLRKGITIEPTKTNAGRRAVDLDQGTVAVLRSHIGKQMADRDNLPDGQAWLCVKLTRKYQRQVPGDILGVLGIGASEI